MNFKHDIAFKSHYNQKNLLKKIFQSDSPELYVKQLPAQALYLTIKQNGLSECFELLELCTVEQCQLFLDLDCWNADSFNEENFWHWLELPDCAGDTPDIEILEKILSASDLKIVAFLLGKYVNFHVNEEPTDEPPAGDYFTPDLGYTWVNVKIPDHHRNFLLNRFLAMIFDLDPRIFYQLISVPSIATVSQLEEDSFQEKQKRLESEGFPSWERAMELNTPLKFDSKQSPDTSKKFIQNFNPKNLPTPAFEASDLQPLTQLWGLKGDTSELDAELTMLINSAMVRWRLPLDDFEQINFCAEQVTGAINIGLEVVVNHFHNNILQIYETYFLQKLYRIGLGEIYQLQKLAKKIDKEKLQALSKTNPELFQEIAGVLENFPQLAISNNNDDELVTEYQAFRYLIEINQLSHKVLELVE